MSSADQLKEALKDIPNYTPGKSEGLATVIDQLSKKKLKENFESNPYIFYRLGKDRHGRYQSSETMSEWLGYLKCARDFKILKDHE